MIFGFEVLLRLSPGKIDVDSSNGEPLFGLLKFDGEPPTDKEVGEIRADYLLEKYS